MHAPEQNATLVSNSCSWGQQQGSSNCQVPCLLQQGQGLVVLLALLNACTQHKATTSAQQPPIVARTRLPIQQRTWLGAADVMRAASGLLAPGLAHDSSTRTTAATRAPQQATLMAAATAPCVMEGRLHSAVPGLLA